MVAFPFHSRSCFCETVKKTPSLITALYIIMAAVLKHFVSLYHELIELRDPRTADWLLSGSPWSVITILISYWFFVFRVGPAMMQDRKPFNLKTIILTYNAIQVATCSYLVYHGITQAYGPGGTYDWFCEPIDTSNSPHALLVARCVHMYFILKVLDLLDTVFFVLRKKQSQVTFLHVYHHMGMAIIGWLASTFLPGGQGVMLGLVNCFVHAVMYSYYFITVWNPDNRKNVWWKKHITQLQILQFLILVLHNLALLLRPPCGYPRWPSFFFIPQYLFFLILFTDFYRKSYK